MPQGGFGSVSYASDPNMSSQTQPSISFPHDTPQYQLQTSDGVVATQDGAVNAMAGLSEEEMLATLRAIGNPNWWSSVNVMMPGYADLLSPGDMVSDRFAHKQILLAKSNFDRISGKHRGSPCSALPFELLSVRCHRVRRGV
jgi:hypothetical protein